MCAIWSKVISHHLSSSKHQLWFRKRNPESALETQLSADHSDQNITAGTALSENWLIKRTTTISANTVPGQLDSSEVHQRTQANASWSQESMYTFWRNLLGLQDNHGSAFSCTRNTRAIKRQPSNRPVWHWCLRGRGMLQGGTFAN